MKEERYQIRLLGSVKASWSAYFDDLSLTAEPGGVTSLVGAVADQAALHGLLHRIRDLNLALLSVQLLEGDTPVECRHCPLVQPPRAPLAD
ncbi:MAG: hypothetical protein ACYC4L_07300 [Chloroflexota bacterium]